MKVNSYSPPKKILYAVRVDRADLIALKIVARQKKAVASQLVRDAIKQIIRDAA